MSFSIGTGGGAGMGPRGALHRFGERSEGRAFDRRIIRRLLVYVRPHWQRLALALLLVLVVSGLTLITPYLFKVAIDQRILRRIAFTWVPYDDQAEVACLNARWSYLEQPGGIVRTESRLRVGMKQQVELRRLRDFRGLGIMLEIVLSAGVHVGVAPRRHVVPLAGQEQAQLHHRHGARIDRANLRLKGGG